MPRYSKGRGWRESSGRGRGAEQYGRSVGGPGDRSVRGHPTFEMPCGMRKPVQVAAIYDPKGVSRRVTARK